MLDVGRTAPPTLLSSFWLLNGTHSAGPLFWDRSTPNSLCSNSPALCLLFESRLMTRTYSACCGDHTSLSSLLEADQQIKRFVSLIQYVSPPYSIAKVWLCLISCDNFSWPIYWTPTSCYYEEVFGLSGPLASYCRDLSPVQRPR